MSFFKRSGGAGGGFGGKKFGGGRDAGSRGGYAPRGGDFGGRDSGARAEMFPAVCAECNNECEVPFKPNGRKPVLCHNCFKKDEQPRDRGFDGGFSKPRFSERPAFNPAPQANPQLQQKLDDINAKLDRIIREIEAMKENQA